jgi:uncharacterized protein (TIGR02118 family)
MYKTVGIYKNVTDSKAFEKYYVSKVMPRLLSFPGVIKMKISDLLGTAGDNNSNINGINFIIETHFETIEDLRRIVDSEEGKEIIQLILNNPYGDCGTYIGEHQTFTKES